MKHFLIKHTPLWIKKIIVKIIRRVELKKYKGTNVYCPVCEIQLKSFAPDRHNVRKNARCANCDSLERHRLYWKYLIDNIFTGANSEKLKVLHIAPERSFYNNLIKMKNIDYYPGDLNPTNFSLKMYKIDVTELPYKDDSFDVIISNHVLEHIPEDQKAMKAMKRVLKPGGVGFIQVPLDYKKKHTYENSSIVSRKDRKKAFGHETHVRIYGQDFIERMEIAGFKVAKIDYYNTFSTQKAKYYGLRETPIFISTK